MAVKINSVTITPQTTTINQSLFIQVEVVENNWSVVKEIYSSWQSIKSSFSSWAGLKNL